MSKIAEMAATIAYATLESQGIKVDPPRVSKNFSSLDLIQSHGVNADFYFRPESFGLSIKKDDVKLFHLLGSMISEGSLVIRIQGGKILDDGVKHPSHGEFWIDSFTSGQLVTDENITISNDINTHGARAAAIAMMSVNNWIRPMMPIIKTYGAMKRALLL